MFDSLQIIIPVYNEGENISRTLDQIESKISTPHNTLIVYDFDEDNTLPVVNQFIRERNAKNVTLVKNSYGKGVLNAIRTGFDSTKEGVVLVVMADSSDDLSVVDSMFEKINQGYDIVCGSRYMKGGKQVGGPIVKGLLSRIAGSSLHFITRIPTHDITNSFKMYRKSVLNDIKIESMGGFEIGMEILVKSFIKGYKIVEIPSTWQDRAAGKSKFKLRKWLPGYIRWYLYAIRGRCKYMLV
jgi:glycosyltransferase involved in cell wall biosynthesis